jgi:ubiquinone/menaquinone biosynthesis C-methylase UbiE
MSETEAWTAERATRWIAMSDAIDRQFTSVLDLVLEAAALQPGERVLDVGCGTGPSTVAAAALVGPHGSVVAADVSTEMIAAASARPVAAESAPIEWVVADAQTWQTGGAPFDVVLSRFGVMFFDDAAAAFANLHAMAAPGGRLCASVWAHRPDSEMFDLLLSTTLGSLAAQGVEPGEVPPIDWGPFSLGDASKTAAMLAAAGWRDVAWTPHDIRIPIGGGLSPAEAAPIVMQLGPTRMALMGADDDVVAAVERRVIDVLRDHLDDAGHVVLGGKIAIITGDA